MPRPDLRGTAREILEIIPLVMRTVAAELRAAGEMPAPAHFGLLMTLANQPRTLTELASLQGVSLPTMSNSISTLVQRGWVQRSSPAGDRRVVVVQVTPLGTATVARVSKAAEAHLAELLAAVDEPSRGKLRAGLDVLRRVFAPTANGSPRGTKPSRSRTTAESVSSNS
jgi:DNA-binding MarR family transcriptional regulator